MRFQRMRRSWIAMSRAWPMWRDPVTLGGGMTIVKGSPPSWNSGRKTPADSHRSYQFASTSCGSYACSIGPVTHRAAILDGPAGGPELPERGKAGAEAPALTPFRTPEGDRLRRWNPPVSEPSEEVRKDPLAVITHPQNKIRNLTEQQIRAIFTGMITNWKSLGGRDHDIVLVVPGKNTAAFKNFDRQVIKRGEIIYDFMTYKSTMAIKAVKKFPHAISFIAHGAASRHSGIKTIKIDGLSPNDENYPYFQVFSFVSKGEPVGLAKKFIAFALSDKGRAIVLDRGMTPVTK